MLRPLRAAHVLLHGEHVWRDDLVVEEGTAAVLLTQLGAAKAHAGVAGVAAAGCGTGSLPVLGKETVHRTQVGDGGCEGGLGGEHIEEAGCGGGARRVAGGGDGVGRLTERRGGIRAGV